MNRIYRIVFNHTLGVPQVASELASAPKGGVVDGEATRPALKSRALALAVSLVLASVAMPALAQACTASATVLCGAAGGNGGNGALGSTVGAAGSGAAASGAFANAGGQGGAQGAAGSAGLGVNGSGGAAGSPPGAGAGGSAGTSGYGGGGGGGTGLSGTATGGGGGGGGGAGQSVAGNASFSNPGSVTGGAGGNGGYGPTDPFSSGKSSYGGGGGGGGAGIFAGVGSTLTNSGGNSITGGSGGNGGNGGTGSHPAAGGGGGGVGVAGYNFTLTSGGTITGGRGGNAGTQNGGGSIGNGGAGGAGVEVTGAATVTNTGSITGGAGGRGTITGAGGAGVIMEQDGNTLINSGSISGGVNGAGTVTADAVDIVGTDNTLQLLSGYSFTGNVYAQPGNGNSLNLGGSNNASFNAGIVLGGFTTYVKQDASTWTLTGSTSLVTPWFLNGGTLAFSSDATLGASSGALTLNSGVLEVTASTSSSRAISITGGGNVMVDAGVTWVESGVINGPGGLFKSGSGTLVLTGSSGYAGGTTISAGTLQLGNGGIAGTIGGNVGDNGVLSFDSNSNVTFNGAISGSGAVQLTGTGAVVLTGNNTYTGGTTINSGILQISQSGSIVGAVANNGTLTFAVDTASTFGGDISGAGAVLEAGNGGITLTGANTSIGVFYVETGSLALSGNGSIANASVNDSTLFDISQTTSGASITSLSGSGSVNLGAQTLTLTQASGTFSGVINGTLGGLTVYGGTEVLTGNNLYTGATTINGGTLTLRGSGSIAASKDVVDNATLNITSNASIKALNGNGALTLGTNTLTLTQSSGIFGGTISGITGSLLLAGGTLSLSGSNNYGGLTTIGAGTTLTLVNGGSIASSSHVLDNGTFDISHTSGTSITSLGGSGSVNLGALTLTLTNASDTFSGSIIGSGGLTLNGGTETLTGNNTLSGTVTVNSGTLQVNAGSTLPQVAALVDNGTVVVDGGGSSLIAGSGGGTPVAIGDNGVGALTLSNGATVISNGQMNIGQNAGDTGTVTVTSDAQLSSTSFINVGQSGTGTLNVTAGGNVSANGWLSVGDGAGSNGTVLVDGSGSRLSSTNISVGNHDATGVLTVSNGAMVTGSSSFTIAADSGSVGTVNIGAAAGSAAAAAGTLNTSTVAFGNGAGTLVFNLTDTGYVFAPTITGNGTVDVLAGTTLFTANNSYTGTTAIGGGTLQLGNGGSSGWIATNVADNGALVFDRSDNVAFANVISGSGSVMQNGSGTLALNGINNYTGGTTVNSGTLLIGDVSHPNAQVAGDVGVSSGATLGGFGTIGGNVTVAGGAHLAPGGSGGYGTLSIGGNLSVAQGAVLDYGFSAPGNGYSTPGMSDQVNVSGNLTLNGATLNVNNDASFGPGIYRLFQFNGTLTETNDGITLGTVPVGDVLSIQTLAGQINLVDTGGAALNMWSGSGTWSATSSNWTDANGNVSSAIAPQPGFAVFGGTPGTVTIDNSVGAVSATGMQFAVNGYVMNGDALTLAADSNGNAPVIRVGDGTANGASYTAEIDNVLAGTAGINKTDLGTLILGGANTYTGGTTISGGTLQIGNGGTGGSVLGDVVDNGTLVFAHSDDVTFNGAISGAGNLAQSGTGTLTLANTETYSGTTTINTGTLALSSTGSIAQSSSVIDNGTFDISSTSGASITSLSGAGNVNLGAQTLTLTQAADTFGGTLSGTGGSLVLNAGTEVLTGSNTYTGSTTINGGSLQLGNGGSSGSIATDVLDNGTLVFDRSDNVVFGNVISGSGGVVQNGSGTLTLGNSNAYTGTTVINAGVLSGGTNSFGSGDIIDNASLVLSQSGVGLLLNTISGSGSLSVNGSGTIVLTGSNSYTGGTTITAGSLVGDSNSLQGAIVDNGTLGFQQMADGSYAGALSGGGTLISSGAAVLSLTGNSSAFTGSTQIMHGALQVDGALGGDVDAATGTTLAGHGTLGGNVTIESGATLAPGDINGGAAIGTLAVGGNLTMQQGSVYNADVGTAGATLGTVGSSDSVSVNGNLALNGVTLNVNDAGNMGPGIYNLFSYSGTLSETNGGIALGTIPTGNTLVIENLTGNKQIDLVNTTSLSIDMWNGDGSASSTQLGGGSGTWSATSQNFSNAGGGLTAPMSPQPGFAVFGGTAGTVTVSDSAGTVSATGMQFASNGYVMNGDTLTLVANAGAAPIIRVGDGSAQGAGYVAQIDNVLAGNAGINKIDNGTLVLAAANTYTGGTTISGGTLQLGNGGNSGSILGNVTDNGTLAFNRADAVNFAGVVSGTGNLVQMGGGTLTLGTAETYTGATTVSAGTLALSGQGSLADSSHLIDNAVFDISQTSGASIRSLGGNGNVNLGAQTLTLSAASDRFSGVIQGSGGVTLAGGTQVLTGANTYSGSTTINAGTLQLGNGGATGSIAGNVVDNGKLAFDRSDDILFSGTISGSGSVQQVSAGSLALSGVNTYTGGTSIQQGTLALNNASAIGSGTLAMAAGTTLHATTGFTLVNAITLSGDPDVNVDAGFTTTLAGVISDGTQAGDLVKTGAGTLVLSAADTYTGNTEVAAGVLDVSGSLVSHVTVDNGAALIGTGSIGGLNVVSGGVVAPGVAGIGTLQVNGNVSLAAGSIYQLDANDAGNSDLIRASGTATLGGGSVISTEAGSNWKPSTRYTILTAGNVSGTFGGVSSNFAFLTPTVSYDASNVYMTLTRNGTAFGSVGTTANEINTGNAIAMSAPTAVYAAVLPLAAAPARAAFDSLSGGSLASTRTAILDDSHFVRDAISTHLQQVHGVGQLLQNDAEGSVWASTWGHGGSHDSDGNAASMHATGSGLLVGADRNLDAWRVGAVAGTGELSDSNINGGGDAHSIDKVFGFYTGVSLGAWQLQGGATHSWYDTQNHRQISVAGIQGSTTAHSNNGVTQAYLDGGYQFTFAQGSLTPYVDVARAWMHQGAINENGDAAALSVLANSSNVNYATAGLRGIYEPTQGLQLHATVGYQQAWGDLRSVDQQSFAGSSDTFAVAGVPVAKSAGVLDLGMRFAINSKVSVEASYHGQFAGSAKDEGGRLAVNVDF